MSLAIKAENVSKKYIIGHETPERYKTLRDTLTSSFKAIFKKNQYQNNFVLEEFWALRDIAFEINQGDRVGVIGRNGAGKSTLLKVLSRITDPTTGRIAIKGHVASLLEVGTGFHPELTGRENIFLNGAILGMSKAEIKKKFDEIVDFSEVEKFLDTPVKRFSSGMYVRLAFSVAAHMEPEILIVDEVLAVGDAQFQLKCLGKMKSIGGDGRTVIFVSHNMQAVRSLCQRSILLDRGRILYDGNIEETISQYNNVLKGIVVDDKTGINNQALRRGNGNIRFTEIQIMDINDKKQYSFETGAAIKFYFSYKAIAEINGLIAIILFRSGITREIIASIKHIVTEDKLPPNHEGVFYIEIAQSIFRPGEYPIYFYIGDTNLRPISFDVVDDLTPPLVITAKNSQNIIDFESSNANGYFSIPSELKIIN